MAINILLCYGADPGCGKGGLSGVWRIDWTPEGGSRRWGRPKRTRQDTCIREDLQEIGVSGSDTHEARSIASDRAQWRQLVAQCSSRDRRT